MLVFFFFTEYRYVSVFPVEISGNEAADEVAIKFASPLARRDGCAIRRLGSYLSYVGEFQTCLRQTFLCFFSF